MKEPKKEKRVSWASGAKLCQLKYFKKADCPAKVGRQTCGHRQLEAPHSYPVDSANMNLQIPQVQWKIPPKFILRSNWSVAAGEESEEIEVQKQREIGVLEAFYPCLSSIPPSPLISLNTEGQLYDDSYTPILPITATEETTEKMDLSCSAPSSITIDSPVENQCQGPLNFLTLNISRCKSVLTLDPSNSGTSAPAISQSLEGDIVIATVAAANAILKSKDPGSLIDTDLLVQLLRNPEMTQELINKHMLSSTTDSRTSESTGFVHEGLLPSSQVPKGKSDDENTKTGNAGTGAIHSPLIIKLSSSAPAKSETASGPKPIEASVSLLRSTNDLPSEGLSHENNQTTKGGNIAAMQNSDLLLAANAGIGSSSSSKQVILSHASSTCDLLREKSTRSLSGNTRSQTVSKPANQSPAAKSKKGTCCQPNQAALLVSLSCPLPDLLCSKPTKKHGPLASIGTITIQKPATNEVRKGSAPNTVTPSVSSLMSVCDLPGNRSTNEHNQQAGTQNTVAPKLLVAQSVTANTNSGIGFREKAGTPPVSVPISFHGLPRKNFKSEHNQQVNSRNEAALKPVITQSTIVNIGTGSGFTARTGTPPVSLPTLTHDFPGKGSSSEQIQQVNAGNMVIATPVVRQSVAVNTRTGTGFRVKPGAVPLSTNDLPGKKSPNGANAVSELVAENRLLVPETYTLNNSVVIPVAENQPPSAPWINAEFLGTLPNFGSSPVAKPVHLTGPKLDISRLKKLIGEHGAHVDGGHAAVPGTSGTSPNPLKPNLDMLKKMVSQYGLQDNSESPLPRSEHRPLPSPVTVFDIFSPLREQRQPPQIQPAPSSACPIMEFEPRFQKPCLYYNTPQGCRNGSSCRFLHDPSKQWRFGDAFETPKSKRMRPGSELTGRR